MSNSKNAKFHRLHHQFIYQALQQFNADYLTEHHILFGGGTRIAFELDEFRQSVDIDFLCTNADSYRAVRSVVTTNTQTITHFPIKQVRLTP